MPSSLDPFNDCGRNLRGMAEIKLAFKICPLLPIQGGMMGFDCNDESKAQNQLGHPVLSNRGHGGLLAVLRGRGGRRQMIDGR